MTMSARRMPALTIAFLVIKFVRGEEERRRTETEITNKRKKTGKSKVIAELRALFQYILFCHHIIIIMK